jgi:MFS family permease
MAESISLASRVRGVLAHTMFAFLQRLSRDVRALPRPVFVLVGGQFVNRFGAFVMPFLALFLTGRGFSMGAIAAVIGAMSVGSLFGPFVSGYLSDALGRRNTIVLSLVTSATSLLGLYWCSTVPALMALSAFHGFCAFLYNPAANALLTDLVTPEQRVTAFALMRLAVNAGFSVGPAVAGLLYHRAPILIFIGDAVTTLLFAAFAWAWLPHGLRTVEGRAAALAVIWQSWAEALVDVARNRRFLQYLAALLFMAISFLQAGNVLAIDTMARGITPEQYGVIMGFNGVLIVCFELAVTQWARRFSLRRVLIAGYSITGLGCASFAFAHGIGGYLLAMTFYTFGEMLSLPIGSSYSGELAPEKFRGRYFGVSGTVWAIAGLVGSGGIWCYGQIGTLWWIVAGASGVVGGLILLPQPRRPAPVATATAG